MLRRCIFILLALAGVSEAFAQQSSKRVLVFVSDGMRQDFMKQFAGEGKMPAYERLLREGVDSGKGMIPPIPPNSGVSWATLGTGAAPSVTGVTGNSFHDNSQPFTPNGISAWSPGANQAQTIAVAAEKAGLKVAVLGWQTFDKSTLKNGIVIEPGLEWFTARGLVANYDVPLLHTDLRNPLDTYLTLDKVQLREASGWENVPPSFSPAHETSFSMKCIPCTSPTLLAYDIFVFDSSDDRATNYDYVIVSTGKDGANAVARLNAGDWSKSVKTSLSGGFYFKLIDLAADLSRFRLYYTPVTRVDASQQSLENYLADTFDSVVPDDYGPFISGLIDAQTYIEQSLQHVRTLQTQIYPHVLRSTKPDLVLAGLEITDSVQHRMLAWAVPGNDLYDPINGPTYWRYIQESYQAADDMLNGLWAELPSANVFAVSDHGMSVSGKVINANYLLERIGLFDSRNLAASKAVAYGSGGLSLVYINLTGRNPNGVVRQDEFDSVKRQIVDAFNELGPAVIEKIMLKEEADSVDAAGFAWNIQHQNRTGDVLVFARPPYQYAAPVAGRFLADLPFMAGQHGYTPNGDADRYAVFAAAGPRIVQGKTAAVPTALDLVPAIAVILGISPPAQSQAAAPSWVRR